ncbi:MAG: STAS domain-containing protein, partial [Planctomycetaceae bacterium]|nr:STAS domain-containing protein [Planctomycetaceae bacterium]
MFQKTCQGTVHIISGSDAITSKSADELNAFLDECLSKGQPRIVLNLEQIPLLDSAGLTLLLDTSDRCAQRGGLLQLASPNSLCSDILRATGVGDSFEVF